MRSLAIVLALITGLNFHFAQAQQVIRSEGSALPVAPTAGFVGQTMFVHLDGMISADEEASLFLDRMNNLFGKPLREKKIGHYFYIIQVSGRQFFMNFIAEPFDSSKSKDFADYVAQLEKLQINGSKIDFQLVKELHETATLQTGNWDENAEDPFVKAYEIDRSFNFQNIAQWLQFTDNYGFAIKSKDHDVFVDLMKRLIKDPKDYQRVSEELTKSNMAAIDPRVSILLENNQTVGSNFEETPFLPYRFIRSCFLQAYESGTCYP